MPIFRAAKSTSPRFGSRSSRSLRFGIQRLLALLVVTAATLGVAGVGAASASAASNAAAAVAAPATSVAAGTKPAPHKVSRPHPRLTGALRSERGHMLTEHTGRLAPKAAVGGAPRAAAATPSLQAGSGTVMNDVQIYSIFWLPAGSTVSADYQQLVQHFLSDIGGPYYNVVAQYGVNNNVNWEGSWVDANPLPKAGTQVDPLDDTDVQTAIQNAYAANTGWQAPGLNTLYLVYLPSGVELCSGSGSGRSCTFGAGAFCAYHNTFTVGTSQIVYGAMPYGGDNPAGCGVGGLTAGPNADLAADSVISTTSHEVMEAVTDPVLTAWRDFTDTAHGQPENGDLCRFDYNAAAADGGNITLNGNSYFLESEWSNTDSGCVAPSGAMLPAGQNAGCYANQLAPNDDGSTLAVPLGFTMNFYGNQYSNVYVNNNGNLTFNAALSTYTPFGVAGSSQPIIAPYFGDVFTATYAAGLSLTPTSGLLTYGSLTFQNRPAFCATWTRTGYYAPGTDKLDSFQVLLVNRDDRQGGDVDVWFNYDKIGWEAGNASAAAAEWAEPRPAPGSRPAPGCPAPSPSSTAAWSTVRCSTRTRRPASSTTATALRSRAVTSSRSPTARASAAAPTPVR
jgi:hypothetical protein